MSFSFFPEETAFVDPLTTTTDIIPPKVHDLQSILASLVNVRITYQQYSTANGVSIFRRELFDVKHQLMLEDEPEEDVLVGESDLKKNIYEGGLKSWECCFDLIDKLHSDDISINGTYLELGCGTGLPSCYLVTKLLAEKTSTTIKKVILTDFNYSVLRLVTIPNLLINWCASCLADDEFEFLTKSDDEPVRDSEIFVTETLLNQFVNSLASSGIELTCISGSWGSTMLNLLPPIDLLLTSETIYSPESLKLVGELVIQAIDSQNGKCLVAAKNFYFGVGGSVIEFESYLNSRKEECGIDFSKVNVGDGLKRSIIEINKI